MEGSQDVPMEEAGGASVEDEDNLWKEDFDNVPLSSLKNHIKILRQLCNGEREPPICRETLDPTIPYHRRAQEVLKWTLSMQGVSSGDEVYDEVAATEKSAGRFSLFGALLKSYHRYIDDMIPPQSGRSADEQAAYTEALVYLHALGHAHTVLMNVDKISRCVHILTRILYNEQDQIVGNVMTDPVRSYQEEAFINAWKAKKDGGEPAEAKRKKDHLTVVHHCLDTALAHRYKRQGSCVYEERKVVFNDVVYGTRAFQPAVWPNGNARRDKSTIGEFVTHACSKDRNPSIWELSVDSTVFRKVVDYLERCVDKEFPSLRQQRNLFSFNNGIYDSMAGYTGAFYSYDMAGKYLLHAATAAKFFEQDVRPQWFEVGGRIGGWFDIPTPLFQSVLNYQNYGEVRTDVQDGGADGVTPACPHNTALVEVKRSLYSFLETMENVALDSSYANRAADKTASIMSMVAHCQTLKETLESVVKPLRDLPESGASQPPVTEPHAVPETRASAPGKALPPEVQRWIYIFLGRLLHDLNEYDCWQIMPFLKGKAGTGKSLIALLAKAFFEEEQVGILSSNVETKFGLGPLADKFVIICLEVKKNFQMNQAEFQSIVSGEMIQLAVKNKDAFAKKWTAPGLLCGNEWANYQDAQGSIARRLAIVNFAYSISEKDSNPNLLDLILSQELAALLIKCNIGYREQASIKKGQDIWKILPPYFKHQRRLLQIETDPLWATIWDDNLFHHTATGYVLWLDFLKEYVQKWKQIRGNPFPEQLTEEKIGAAFKDAKLAREWLKKVDPGLGGEAKMDDWVLGLRLRRDIPEQATAAARASADAAS